MIKDHKPLPLNKLILLIVVFINIIVLRSGLLDQNNYKYLFFTIPLVFLSLWHKQRMRISLRSEVNGKRPSRFFKKLFPVRKSKPALRDKNVMEKAAADIHDPAGTHSRKGIISKTSKDKELKVCIGNRSCRQPYHSSIFNLGRACNHSIPWHNGENSSSPDEPENSDHHLVNGDLIWKIAAANITNSNNEESRKNILNDFASRPEIKMIEIKLAANEVYDSSLLSLHGYRSGKERTAHGPYSQKENPATIQAVAYTPEEVLLFIKWLRKISNGKPVGIAFTGRERKEFIELLNCIKATGIIPDFITVQENAGLINTATSNPVDLILYDTIDFTKHTLLSYGLTQKIKIIAEGRIMNGFDIIKLISVGASVCYKEKYDSKSKDRGRSSQEISNEADSFYSQTMETAKEIMIICGLNSIENIQSSGFMSRLKEFEMRNLKHVCFLDMGNHLKKDFNNQLN
jgi:hypothetical protein